MPRILYIADAKSGNPAPKESCMKSLPANTEANTGKQNNPARNRKARNIPKLLATAVGIWRRTQMMRVPIYIQGFYQYGEFRTLAPIASDPKFQLMLNLDGNE